MVKFVKHVFGCTNCWLDAARHLRTTIAWRFDFAFTAGAFGDLHLGSIVQLKTVIDQCDITFCTVGVDRHPTFITRINGHHIAPLKIEKKPTNDDRSPGVCPDFLCDFYNGDISAALRAWNIGLFAVQVRNYNFFTISNSLPKGMIPPPFFTVGWIDLPCLTSPHKSIVMLIEIAL
jgi:hypothetical protein